MNTSTLFSRSSEFSWNLHDPTLPLICNECLPISQGRFRTIILVSFTVLSVHWHRNSCFPMNNFLILYWLYVFQTSNTGFVSFSGTKSLSTFCLRTCVWDGHFVCLSSIDLPIFLILNLLQIHLVAVWIDLSFGAFLSVLASQGERLLLTLLTTGHASKNLSFWNQCTI